MKKNNIKATFFIVGSHAQAHPDMVKHIVQEGKAIGNHSWDHPIMYKLSSDEVKTEITKTEQLLYSLIGYRTSIFRPPYGETSYAIIKEIGSMEYKIIDWSVDTRGWAGTPTPQIMDYVQKEVKPGGIILQLCAGGKEQNLTNTVYALQDIITSLKSKGYIFVTVPQLLDIPAVK